MLPVLAALAASGAATGAAAFAYATLVEPYWLQIRRVELGLRRLPRRLDGLTVLHLSDLHVHASDPAGQVVVRRAARVSADIVCLTGDYGDIPSHAHLAAPLLDPARGRLGTFAVLGNHDRDATPERQPHVFSDDVGFAVGAALEARGISVLYNQAVPLEIDGQRLWIVGLDDPHLFDDDVERAYLGVPSDEPSIVLAHSWEPTADCAARGARLFLCGHTHGGQVRLPIVGAPMHQTYRRPPRNGGLSWVGRTALHVSHGLGGTHKLRFAVRPQAVVFTLRSL
jgi:predicted MPP superfamily phosphohydrolase